jgi:(S)-mandelate dehydrogenase
VLYGFGAAGADGAARALEILKGGIDNELGQLGVPSLDRLSPAILRRADALR